MKVLQLSEIAKSRGARGGGGGLKKVLEADMM